MSTLVKRNHWVIRLTHWVSVIAIVIMAAVGFAGLLVVILRSGEVQAILTDLVQRALNSAG